MLLQIALGGWVIMGALLMTVPGRIMSMLRSDAGRARRRRGIRGGPQRHEADAIAIERLLEEIGGVVDLIEAEAARLEPADEGRTLTLAKSLLASSMSRYRERVPREA